jgi:hypothetical protein
MTTDRPKHRKFAYENPADLAWGAQMVNTWAKRRRARIAAEHLRDHDEQASRLEPAEGGDGG